MLATLVYNFILGNGQEFRFVNSNKKNFLGNALQRTVLKWTSISFHPPGPSNTFHRSFFQAFEATASVRMAYIPNFLI
jgi:hypothetical protein